MGSFRRKTVFPLILALAALGACSSAPKGPVEIRTLRTMAATQLDLANREADRGNLEEALDILEKGRQFAVRADDPPLLVRTGLARGNILRALGRGTEAAAAWALALAEAEQSGEPELAALCRIYQARGRLLAAAGGPAAAPEAEAVRAAVMGELSRIKQDQRGIALGWTVIGLAEKENRRWKAAEAAFKRALEIHQRDNYLEQTAYDWFLIASVRSVAGDYNAAREALETALSFDRRAENSYGLAADWRALGEVYRKSGDSAAAEAAFRRAAAIFRIIGRETEAAELEARSPENRETAES